MSFMKVLFLIFLTLKLTDQIDWSWWNVFGPLIFEFSLVVMIEHWKRTDMVGYIKFLMGL